MKTMSEKRMLKAVEPAVAYESNAAGLTILLRNLPQKLDLTPLYGGAARPIDLTFARNTASGDKLYEYRTVAYVISGFPYL